MSGNYISHRGRPHRLIRRSVESTTLSFQVRPVTKISDVVLFRWLLVTKHLLVSLISRYEFDIENSAINAKHQGLTME